MVLKGCDPVFCVIWLQHFRSAITDAWRDEVSGEVLKRKGFRGGPILDIRGSLQLLNSSMFGSEKKRY